MDIIDIQQLRNRAVEMMVEVKTIFEKHHVTFWIEYGTMLGAVRSGEMIPWDNEIDIGVFDTSFTNKDIVLNDLKNNGYEIKFTPDRIKIYKAGWWLGSFNIDVHLYHIDKDEAYVSAGIQDMSAFAKLIERIAWIISLYNSKQYIVYRFDKIMKLLKTRFNVLNTQSLPQKIMFKKGRYNSPLSFQIYGENFCLEKSPIDENTTIYTLFAIKLVSWLPTPILKLISGILAKLRPIPRYSTAQQRVPIRFYTNLSQITLCGIPFMGPKEREEYLELIYGLTWRIPNSNWAHTDMCNLK